MLVTGGVGKISSSPGSITVTFTLCSWFSLLISKRLNPSWFFSIRRSRGVLPLSACRASMRADCLALSKRVKSLTSSF